MIFLNCVAITAPVHTCVNELNGKCRSEFSDRNKTVTIVFPPNRGIVSHQLAKGNKLKNLMRTRKIAEGEKK